MACTVERVLSDARLLVNRLKDHDVSADTLIAQSQSLHQKMDAMKEYQEDLNQLNEIARHRPRANLIMGLLQENNQIRELQAENRDLRLSLEEHQSAIGLIMTKYREQVVKLMTANHLDISASDSSEHSQVVIEMQDKIDKICEMAAVMQKAVSIDEQSQLESQRLVTQLSKENGTLRDLLRISTGSSFTGHLRSQHTQTIAAAGPAAPSPAAAAAVDEDRKDLDREKENLENEENHTNGNASRGGDDSSSHDESSSHDTSLDSSYNTSVDSMVERRRDGDDGSSESENTDDAESGQDENANSASSDASRSGGSDASFDDSSPNPNPNPHPQPKVKP